MAKFPSALIPTEEPCLTPNPLVTAPVPTNLFPCWLQTPELRVKIQVAPKTELSEYPPTMAVFPSALILTELP